MKLCLDTCAYSRLAAGLDALIDCVDDADRIFLPMAMVGETLAGFCCGTREVKNRRELEAFLELPGVAVVDIDYSIADRYAMLVKTLRTNGTPIPTNDIWIAATALETGSRLVTYDEHFKCIPGLPVMAP